MWHTLTNHPAHKKESEGDTSEGNKASRADEPTADKKKDDDKSSGSGSG